MSYPLIIVGAGASADSDKINRYTGPIVHEMEQYQPPLTKGLFDRRKQPIKEILDIYNHVSQLATHANRRIAKTQDLESYLKNIAENIAPTNKERYKELVALRFYLADLFKIISEKFHQSENNYISLLKEVEDRSEGKVCFINFNYDFLLEKNISDIANASDINALITGSIKVIKIHGCCNWLLNPQIHLRTEKINSGYSYYLSQAENIFQEEYGEIMSTFNNQLNWNYCKKKDNGLEQEYIFYMPAVAIPLPGTHKHIICPDRHIKTMEECIERADRILIIGWRGNDKYLIDLIKSKIGSKKIRLYIVSTNKERAEEVATKFQKTKFDIKSCISEGFSDFLQSEELDSFFSKL